MAAQPFSSVQLNPAEIAPIFETWSSGFILYIIARSLRDQIIHSLVPPIASITLCLTLNVCYAPRLPNPEVSRLRDKRMKWTPTMSDRITISASAIGKSEKNCSILLQT